MLLFIIGASLFYYTINYLEVIDWSNYLIYLEGKGIESQHGSVIELRNLFRRGELWNYLNSQNMYFLLTSIFMIFSGFIGFFHIVIDKFFFKKFYENPHYVRAIRRSILWGLLPVVIVAFAVQNFLITTVLLLVLFITVGMEIVISMIWK